MTPADFVGTWFAADGRRLTIAAAAHGLEVGVYDAAGKPFRLNVLALVPRFLRPKTTGLRGVLDQADLVIEAGSPGLGPTLRLTRTEIEGKAALLPEVRMGLYDDFDEDLGVPWIFPLAPFLRSP